MSDRDEQRGPPLAKKVFFLYPHSVVQDQMQTILIQAEYEVDILNDHKKASSLLYKHKESVLFINIEAELDESEWEQYIRGIMNSRERHGARIGIVVYNPNPDLAQKYLMDIGVECGFITLKIGLAESAKIILKSLEAVEAKGGRRYIRVKTPQGKADINLVHHGGLIKGQMLDISSAGLACILPQTIQTGEVLDDVQLTLWGSRIKVQVKVAGLREQGSKDNPEMIHVLMFGDIDRETKGKIYTFIRRVIQAEIETDSGV